MPVLNGSWVPEIPGFYFSSNPQPESPILADGTRRPSCGGKATLSLAKTYGLVQRSNFRNQNCLALLYKQIKAQNLYCNFHVHRNNVKFGRGLGRHIQLNNSGVACQKRIKKGFHGCGFLSYTGKMGTKKAFQYRRKSWGSSFKQVSLLRWLVRTSFLHVTIM